MSEEKKKSKKNRDKSQKYFSRQEIDENLTEEEEITIYERPIQEIFIPEKYNQEIITEEIIISESPIQEIITEEIIISEIPIQEIIISEIPIQEIITEEIIFSESPIQEIITEEIIFSESPTQEIITEEIITEESPTQEIITEEIIFSESPTQEIITEEIIISESPTQEIITEEIIISESPTQEIITEEINPEKNINNLLDYINTLEDLNSSELLDKIKNTKLKIFEKNKIVENLCLKLKSTENEIEKLKTLNFEEEIELTYQNVIIHDQKINELSNNIFKTTLNSLENIMKDKDLEIELLNLKLDKNIENLTEFKNNIENKSLKLNQLKEILKIKLIKIKELENIISLNNTQKNNNQAEIEF